MKRLTERDRACSGPRDAKVPGSLEWCLQTVEGLKIRWERKVLVEKEFDSFIREVEQHRIWEKIPPIRPYGTKEALLRAELGIRSEAEGRERVRNMAREAEANPMLVGEDLKQARAEGGVKGGRGKKNLVVNNNKVLAGSTNGEYLSRRIHRDHPDILERMKAGEFRSVRAAAIAAGIVKVPTALDVIRKAWRKLSPAERQQFLEWTRDHREEYPCA